MSWHPNGPDTIRDVVNLSKSDTPVRDKTRVIHLRRCPRYWQHDFRYVYIGRPGRNGKGPWGNPFKLATGGDRVEVLGQYRRWLILRLESEPELRKAVAGLAGRILVCFCSPQKCHGDVLAEFADRLAADVNCSLEDAEKSPHGPAIRNPIQSVSQESSPRPAGSNATEVSRERPCSHDF